MPHERVWRDAVILVVAGMALGATHNWIGLRSRPAHGIPWVTVERALPTLESIDAADSAMNATVKSDTVGLIAGTPRPQAPGTPPTHDKRDAAPPAARTPAPSAAPRAPESSTPVPHAAGAAVSTPFIPEMDQPMQVTLSTAKRLFDARAAFFLDARGASEYDAGHIPGAVRLTRDEALKDPDRVKALGLASHPIVTYCDGGSCEASRELARILVEAGYRRVLVYTGGYPEWAAAAHPVARGSAP